MAFKLDEKAKKIVNGSGNNQSAAPVNKPAPVQQAVNRVKSAVTPKASTTTSNTSSSGGFKLDDKARSIVNGGGITVNAPEKFIFGNKVYQQGSDGSYIKTGYQKKRSQKDEQSVLETGHETLGTDIKQATSAGLKNWLAPQLSSVATLGLAGAAAFNGDNNYNPTAGSGLWRMLQASSANAKEAELTRQNSIEGRGKVGATLLEGYSSAVTNGIDTALSLIPYVGPTLTKVSFASRSFGGAAQSARDQGKSVGTQVLNGAISAAIEHVTENLWTYGGVRDLTGSVLDNTGPLGNLTNKLEVGLAKKAGPIVSRLAMTFGTEAVEEMMADVLNPIVGLAVENTLGKTKLFSDYEGEEWQGIGNMLHDGVIGGIAGILGGVSSAAEAIGQFNKAGGTNQLYATALRQEFEQKRDAARADSAAARDIRRAALGGVLDSLFNKKTGRTVSERVSEATGRYVSRKDAFKMVGEIDSDFPAICRQVAHEFAEKNFANEVVNKEALEEGVYKLLVKGEFADELNSIEDARTQIQQLTKEIMTSVAEQNLAEAKGKKNKAQTAFYTSLLSQLVGQNIGENQAESANVDDITEARTYGYTAEELAADQAAREAERQRMESKGTYDEGADVPFFTGEDALQQESPVAPEDVPARTGNTSMTQAEYEAMPVEDKAKWLLDSGNTTIRIEGGNKISTTNRQLFNAIAEEAKARGFNAELVYNEQSNQMEARLTPIEQTAEAEAKAENKSDNAISKADQKKLDKIFTKLGTSIRIKADETVLRDAVYTRAEAENVDVVEGKYGDRITLSIREKATGNPIIDNQREAKAQKNAAEEKSSSEQEMDVDAIIRAVTPIEKLPENIAARNEALKKAKEGILARRQKEINIKTALDESKTAVDFLQRLGYSKEDAIKAVDSVDDLDALLGMLGLNEVQIDAVTRDFDGFERGFSWWGTKEKGENNAGQEEQTVQQSEENGFTIEDVDEYDADEYVDFPSARNGKADRGRTGVSGESSDSFDSAFEGTRVLGELKRTGYFESHGHKYSLGYTDNNGVYNETARLITKAERGGKTEKAITAMRRAADDSTIIMIEGVLCVDDDSEHTIRGVNFPMKDGSSLIVSDKRIEYFVHEATHATIWKLLNRNIRSAGNITIGQKNTNDILVWPLKKALSEERINEIKSRLIKDGYDFANNSDGDYHFYGELYSYFNSNVSFITTEERLKFYSALLKSNTQLLYTLGGEALGLRSSEDYDDLKSEYEALPDFYKAGSSKQQVAETSTETAGSKANDHILSSHVSFDYTTRDAIVAAASLFNKIKTAIKVRNQRGLLMDLAKLKHTDAPATVTADAIADNTNVKRGSQFKLNNYTFSVQYSRGVKNRSFANTDSEQVRQNGGYTMEVYDKGRLVTRREVEPNSEFDEDNKNKEASEAQHKAAIFALANECRSDIAHYERDELKSVKMPDNKVGTKKALREAIDKAFAGKDKFLGQHYKTVETTDENGKKVSKREKDKFVARNFSDNEDGYTDFNVGNYSIRMESTHEETKRGDKQIYAYSVLDTTNNELVDFGTWDMEKELSPAWVIAENIHNYEISQGKQYAMSENPNSIFVKSPESIVWSTGEQETETEEGQASEQEQAKQEPTPQVNAEMQEREERNQDYAERESAAMSDEELWQARRADLDTPTRQDFERSKEEQPKATREMSPAEANEMAERSFGKKGRIRATRAVENFNRIKNPFSGMEEGNGTNLEAVRARMGDMQKALINVNDGYGTVKDVADVYKTWRDNKLMSDYYDEDIAARFDKILEDAEAKGWTFEAQDQREFAQAYEEACNAMTAKINNVNKSADRLSRLKTEAIANKLNIKSDGLISKTIQRFIRMQITTDTAMKLFGGFKGSGEFYKLGKDIKDGVAKRMIKYVDAYSHFDNLKKMEGFKEFSQNTKKYQLEFNNEFNDKGVGLDNPLKGVDLSLQQIVTISRLIKTLDKTFEHSDAKAADRVKGFVIRDSNGNSKTIDLGLGDTTDTGEAVKASGKMTAIKLACDRILNQDGAVFEVARAYDKACDAMFKSMGKDVSAVKKALTGNALSLIGEDYTPVLWANDDGSPAEFNFNDDDRLRPPAFLYNRTAKQGNLVVSDISYIVDKYIEKAADYIGTAEIKDTLSRLNDGTSLLDKGKGLNSSLAENFGKDAGTWFDEYVKDLTQYGENDSIWAALRRNMQKGALIGSPSVMMKQTSSYWSAMGLLSPEALVMAYRWKVGVKAADNSEYNKLLKYRHISDNIDPTLTEIIKGVDKYGKASNSRVFQLFTNGISEQDFKTVDNLYTATMIDTYLKSQNKGAEYFTSGEFQNDIDSKFTEVMMRSQPMFDTELRAEYARTDNELVKMTSMFRTQQTQNLNLIATAIGEYNASKGTGEQGEKLKVLQQTVAGQASAALSLALLSVAADFMLHGLKKYRGDGDDDDEEPGDGKIELGRILGRIGLNTVETGAGTVWFGDSVAKWLIDRMSGGETNEFYGLNMGPITTFKNVLDNLEYVAKSPTPSNIKNVATNISQLMGIPLNNAYRIVNSAVMYVEDVVGANDKNYDDMLKQVTNRTKVNEKNVAGRNLLVESGMTKREATAFVKTVDVDDNGLNKEDLQNYYIEHPEDAERVSILWDSMGWKTKFEKEQKSLDKKVVYNSNPLYAEMDEDESGSVTKTEMMDYALEHEDQIDELSALYKEQGFKGSFRSALKSAENSKLKEQAEDAFYDGDYNVLFDTVSQMKNGKTYLTNLIKDEYDEYDNVSNPLVRYMIDAKRPVKEIDEAVEAYGAKKFIPQYKALRATGLAPKAAIQKLDNFDANANGSITQAELADYYKAHKDEEAMIAEFWKACGWSTTWKTYKKRKKLK